MISFADQVQATLDAVVDAHAERLAPLGPDATLLLDEARTSVRGGKRLRAAFCRAGFTAVAGTSLDGPTEAGVLRAGAALEVLHASALVHDDFMDASDTRRGRPAAHRAFAAHHDAQGWPGSAEQYGGAAAILLGDLLLTWSDELLRTCGLPDAQVADALVVLDHTRSEVVAGQFLDVSVQARGRGSVEEAMRVLRYKSAKYSVERPLHVGAALAGADDAQVSALSDVGLPVGEAFQLRDDLLGVLGDTQRTGKPAGDDLREGKRTVLVALALESLSPADAARLEAGLGTALAPEEVAALQELVRGSGAVEQVERLIDDLTARAFAALDTAPIDAAAREELRALAEAAVRRVV
ncbi:MAG: polyprenyl synthetase family protein [Nocardioides sp.]|nr:polyprenyl synthetase family protein [Nocardioides sp.]